MCVRDIVNERRKESQRNEQGIAKTYGFVHHQATVTPNRIMATDGLFHYIGMIFRPPPQLERGGAAGISRTFSILFVVLIGCLQHVTSQGQTLRETACEGEVMTMTCLGNKIVSVQRATYGRQDVGTCVVDDQARMRDTSCRLDDARQRVQSLCAGKIRCEFAVGRDNFHDPCPDTSKYLTVEYECVPLLQTCEGSLGNVTSRLDFNAHQSGTDGSWMRDPFQQNHKIYQLELKRYATATLWEYASPEAMVRKSPITFTRLKDSVDGTGTVVYDGCVYYNKAQSRNIVKMELNGGGGGQSSSEGGAGGVRREIPRANYHNTSPYAIDMNTDIDLAVDETGLWVIYATEANDGKIVVSKLDRHSLEIVQSWETDYDKMSALNAFVVCGVLYVINYDSLRIDYKFNTSNSRGETVDIRIPGLTNTTSSVSYNPKDRKLYMWDGGVAVLYDVTFTQPAKPAPTTSAPTLPPAIATTTTPRAPRPSPERRPVTPTPTSQRPPGGHQVRYCPGKTMYGMVWPATPYRQRHSQRCPGIGAGTASWQCSGNRTHPQWVTPQPDLGQCVSPWLAELGDELRSGGGASEMCAKLVQQLERNQLTMTSWDVVTFVGLLRDLLDRAQGTPRDAATVTDAIVKSTALLLDEGISRLWKTLHASLQREASVELSTTLEAAAFFLARDLAADSPVTAEPSTLRARDVTLTVNVAARDVRWRSASERVTADVSLTQDGDAKLGLVFAAYGGLGRYMVDRAGMGGRDHPVNSPVVQVSALLFDEARGNGSSYLARPVHLVFAHVDRYLRQHVCVYWNQTDRSSGSWSRSGCRSTSTNRTHTTCECDHMTQFALLSTNQTFPRHLGDDPTSAHRPPGTAGGQQRTGLLYLDVIRIGLVVSVLILTVALVTLVVYSRKLDFNTIHKNLIFATIFTELLFVVGIDQLSNSMLCTVVAAFLHLGIVSIFTWSALECVHLLCDDPTDSDTRWRYYYALGYGAPLLVVIVSSLVDHTAYGGHQICWISPDSPFIWSVVAPCCAVIVISVVCIGLVLRHLHRTNSLTEAAKSKPVRCGAMRSCVLMVLVCVVWSSCIMWMSGIQPQLTACLFSVLSILHALTCLIFYCLLPREVRYVYKMCWSRVKKDDFRTQHLRRAGDTGRDSGFRLVSNQSRRTTIRSEADFPPTSSSSGIPLQHQRRSQTLGCAGTVAAAGTSEGDPLMGGGMTSLPHDLVASCASTCCGVHRHENTDPKYFGAVTVGGASGTHGSHHSQASSQQQLHNHYVRRTMTSQQQQRRCIGGQCSSSDCSLQYPSSGHLYEQPLPPYCQCTTHSSGASSGCYDHLHDGPGQHQRRAQHPRPMCRCRVAQQPPVVEPRPAHHYETLGPFLDVADAVEAPDAMGQVYTQQQQQRYEADPPHHQPYFDHSSSLSSASSCDRRPPSARSNPRSCHHQHHRNNIRTLPEDGHVTASHVAYSRAPTCGCGRSSDPMSTDQGYDTDSQLQMRERGKLLARQQQAVAPPRADSRDDVIQQRRSTTSSTENDLEVAHIITRGAGESPDDDIVVPSPTDDEAGSSLISPTSTVDSWSGVVGSNPRAVNPQYGGEQRARTDPQLILQQAKMNRTSTYSTDGENPLSYAYTLPGTAETGTKARIDLRTGGISMVTNL